LASVQASSATVEKKMTGRIPQIAPDTAPARNRRLLALAV
jgi:hypothetical protein